MIRLPIIDNGHGYNTKGKRAVMSNGITLEEWEFTRMIKLRLISILYKNGIQFHDLVPESNDITLFERVRRANEVYANNKTLNPYLISIHGDAFTSKEANGITVFTTKGQTKSDPIAHTFVEELSKLGWKNRFDVDSDGFKGKEADFYIIKKTKCPAILLELGFYTNETQSLLMHDDIVQETIANILYQAIIKVK